MIFLASIFKALGLPIAILIVACQSDSWANFVASYHDLISSWNRVFELSIGITLWLVAFRYTYLAGKIQAYKELFNHPHSTLDSGM